MYILKDFMQRVKERNKGEKDFFQAVEEVMKYLIPFTEKNPKYKKFKILERLIEPERVIMFTVPWMDDNGEIQINRAYRVEMNSAIGPYKGGLRFHPTVTLGKLKFLAFEQVFKNALTTLPLGGGKGGSDFDPKGKSDNEVMRFCQSFMTELYRHIGPDTDIPAGDIGVGARELGFLFGQYKKITNEYVGAITGKGVNWGGSFIRPEATGYGAVYFAQEMLKLKGEGFAGKRVAISGSGNVAQYAAQKSIELGAKVITLSDSNGVIYDEDGITEEKLEYVFDLKNVRRGRIKEYAEEFGCEYYENEKPWKFPCDIAMPCATENELNGDDAILLLKNGCICVSEGANMPCDPTATGVFISSGIAYGPGKAANAGGVAVSGLEMSQNAMHLTWSREEVDKKLKDIMCNIHEQCLKYGKEDGKIDYMKGANIAGFVKVADAMISLGI